MLYENAKNNYGDVYWQSVDRDGAAGTQVWGHKAVMYARAPKIFKEKYFALACETEPHGPLDLSDRPQNSDAFNQTGHSMDIKCSHLVESKLPTFFHSQLEWMYTGDGFSDDMVWQDNSASEENNQLLFQKPAETTSRSRQREQLSQDMTYMWRSKLYADVRLHLTGYPENDDSDQSDLSADSFSSTAVFTSHRFILASRSPYLAKALHKIVRSSRGSVIDICLPMSQVTPPALHFCLGFIYAGHLDFSNRHFNLQTAFDIYRTASLLQVESLLLEIEMRIVYEFCHGMSWDTCHCQRCSKRVVEVWEFACVENILQLEFAARQFIARGWGSNIWGREVRLVTRTAWEDLAKDILNDISCDNIVCVLQSIIQAHSKSHHLSTMPANTADVRWYGSKKILSDMEAHAANILVTSFDDVMSNPEIWTLATTGAEQMVLGLALEMVLINLASTLRKCPRVYQTIMTWLEPARDMSASKMLALAHQRNKLLLENTSHAIRYSHDLPQQINSHPYITVQSASVRSSRSYLRLLHPAYGETIAVATQDDRTADMSCFPSSQGGDSLTQPQPTLSEKDLKRPHQKQSGLDATSTFPMPTPKAAHTPTTVASARSATAELSEYGCHGLISTHQNSTDNNSMVSMSMCQIERPSSISTVVSTRGETGNGVALHIGIPCIVFLPEKKTRVRARARYLGHMVGALGSEWRWKTWKDLESLRSPRVPLRVFIISSQAQPIPTSTLVSVRLAAIKYKQVYIAILRDICLYHFAHVCLPRDRSASSKLSLVAEGRDGEMARALFVRPKDILLVVGAEFEG
ncbi:hypothetical protein IAT38_006133 [Cryptococcus sp. DSM 104549]